MSGPNISFMQKYFLRHRLATQIFTWVGFSNICIVTHFWLRAVFSKLSLFSLESHLYECLSLAVSFGTPMDSDVMKCDITAHVGFKRHMLVGENMCYKYP